jgi:tetratricopeptide (TPR) repeat protein
LEWTGGFTAGNSGRNKMKKNLLLLFLTVSVLCACTTVGDIFVEGGARTQEDANLEKVEAQVVPLEALGGIEARRQQRDITAARQAITALEREASADVYYTAKLAAWSGRLAILEGRYSEAQRLYRQSSAASQGNLPSIILGINLEGDPQKRLEMIEREIGLLGRNSTGAGELNIERGKALLELNRFSEAAGAFDVAFSSAGLAPVYNESFGTARNRAWELRNTSGVNAGTLNMLVQDTLSWTDCINLIRNETQLLRFITAGRNMPEADIFNRLVERGFIPATQDITVLEWPETTPVARDTVTRAGAAWLIWHLFAEARGDRGLLTRYSARYATGSNPRSPIVDVPPLSPYFDSILGCVEREFLALPDGRNFRPAQSIRGPELLAILRKIDD